MPTSALRVLTLFCLVFCSVACCRPAAAQLSPYNPYADVQEPLAPVAPDGSLQWGTFFKSAALQQRYEQLWNLGACRGTNRRITEPVARNALSIDALPEGEFSGVVRHVGGSLRGGAVAFVTGSDPAATPYLAQLHPAGVSRLTVTGTVPLADIRPGLTVRCVATVDADGRGTEPLRQVDVITPPTDPGATAVVDVITPPTEPGATAVEADRAGTVIGTVTSLRGGELVLRVAAGRLRRLRLPVTPDAVAVLDTSELSLVAPGDTVEVGGKVWRGEGSAGAGTVFAERLIVTKAASPAPVVAAP